MVTEKSLPLEQAEQFLKTADSVARTLDLGIDGTLATTATLRDAVRGVVGRGCDASQAQAALAALDAIDEEMVRRRGSVAAMRRNVRDCLKGLARL